MTARVPKAEDARVAPVRRRARDEILPRVRALGQGEVRAGRHAGHPVTEAEGTARRGVPAETQRSGPAT